jgi:HlyD family secretion protein
MRVIMLKKLAVSTLFVAAVAASLGAYYLRAGKAEVSVNTTTVSVGDVVQSVTATGTLEAVSTVDVGSQVSGTIASLSADFNTIVTRGQLLAQLDPSLLHAQSEQARASLQSAEATVERLRVTLEDAQAKAARSEELNARQLITISDLDSARVSVRVAAAPLRAGEAQLVQASASLHQCEVNEQHARIYSPIAGTVISRSVDVGQTVAASMQAPTLFTIAANLSRLRLKASVSESDIGLVREGQAVTFHVDAYTVETFTGSVTQVRLQPTTTQSVVTYTTIIDVPNAGLRLRPGMTATTTIEIARANGVVRVPNTALRFRPTAAMFTTLGQPQPAGPAMRSGGQPGSSPAAAARPGGAWAWANERLEPVRLTTGISDGMYTQIVSGAPPASAQLVTSLTLPAAAKTSASSTASPLMQQNGPPPPPPGAMGGPPR